MKTEVEFSPENASSVRVLAEMENEYTISVKAPSKMDWDFFFPLSFPIASFLSQPAYPEKCQGHKGKGCSAEKLESRKSWTCILSYGTFDEELRETAACGLCFPLSSSRVAGWKHLAGSSENKLQFVKHFELSCVLWPLPLLALARHQERREVPVNNYMTIMACV